MSKTDKWSYKYSEVKMPHESMDEYLQTVNRKAGHSTPVVITGKGGQKFRKVAR